MPAPPLHGRRPAARPTPARQRHPGEPDEQDHALAPQQHRPPRLPPPSLAPSPALAGHGGHAGPGRARCTSPDHHLDGRQLRARFDRTQLAGRSRRAGHQRRQRQVLQCRELYQRGHGELECRFAVPAKRCCGGERRALGRHQRQRAGLQRRCEPQLRQQRYLPQERRRRRHHHQQQRGLLQPRYAGRADRQHPVQWRLGVQRRFGVHRGGQREHGCGQQHLQRRLHLIQPVAVGGHAPWCGCGGGRRGQLDGRQPDRHLARRSRADPERQRRQQQVHCGRHAHQPGHAGLAHGRGPVPAKRGRAAQ